MQNKGELLLDKAREALVEHLKGYFPKAFENAREILFEKADKATSNNEQTRLFDSLNSFKKHRQTVIDGFEPAFNKAFEKAREASAAEVEENDAPRMEMALLEEEELVESLQIGDMVAKAETKFNSQLHPLNARIGMLLGGGPRTNTTNPLGPHAIGRALIMACQPMTAAAVDKVELFRTFEQLMMIRLAKAYEEINKTLIEAGILPNFGQNPELPKHKSSAPEEKAAAAPPAAEAQAEQAMGSDAPAEGGFAPPMPSAEPTGHTHQYFEEIQQLMGGPTGASGPGMAGDAYGGPGGMAGGLGVGGGPGGGGPGGGGPGGGGPGGGGPGGGGPGGGGPGGGGPGGGAAGGAGGGPGAGSYGAPGGAAQGASTQGLGQPVDGQARPAPVMVDNALAQLQKRLSQEAAVAIDTPAVKKRVSEMLSEQGYSIQPEQQRTMDLMGMVYDYVHEDLPSKRARGLIDQLLVPLIRVALRDPDFFTNPTHPARQLFEAIAHVGELWLDDPAGRPTFEKLNTLLHDVLERPDEDIRLFEKALAEIREHIRRLQKKASVVEKRHVEQMKGKEKLDLARIQSREKLDALIKKYAPPESAVRLLRGPWADYLSLTILRHGEDSEQWKSAVEVAEMVAIALKGRIPPPIAKKIKARGDWLQERLKAGLTQVGYAKSEIAEVSERIDGALNWAEERAPGDALPKALEAPLPMPQHVEEKVKAAETEEPAPIQKVDELSQKEKTQLAKIRLMSFGTWLEFQFEEEGPWKRRKLAWHSPVTGHCLLLNNLGGEAEKLDLPEMAKLMVAGRCRPVKVKKKPLLERAMESIRDRLKGLNPVAT